MSTEHLSDTEDDLLIRSLTFGLYTLSLEDVSVQQMIEQKRDANWKDCDLTMFFVNNPQVITYGFHQNYCETNPAFCTLCRDYGQRVHGS